MEQRFRNKFCWPANLLWETILGSNFHQRYEYFGRERVKPSNKHTALLEPGATTNTALLKPGNKHSALLHPGNKQAPLKPGNKHSALLEPGYKQAPLNLDHQQSITEPGTNTVQN